MSLRNMISCDSCGRQQEMTQGTADVQGSWGSLRVGQAKPRDICPTCIARLGGWGEVPKATPASRTYSFDMAPRGSHVRA